MGKKHAQLGDLGVEYERKQEKRRRKKMRKEMKRASKQQLRKIPNAFRNTRWKKSVDQRLDDLTLKINQLRESDLDQDGFFVLSRRK